MKVWISKHFSPMLRSFYTWGILARAYCSRSCCSKVTDYARAKEASLQPEAEVERTRLLPAADQAAWCCWAPGNAPVLPDVKTIRLTREFPYLPSESECRLSPACSLFLSLSVCLSVPLFSLPLALIPSMESRASQNTHCNRCARYVFLIQCQKSGLGIPKTQTQNAILITENWSKVNNAKKMESFTNAHIVVLGKALLCAEQRAKMT